MEKITIEKLDNTNKEINLVTAFSLEDNNIIIYLTNENPDIVNVTVKTAVGLDSISDELFQKVTEALQIMNEDIFKNNTIDVANTLSEVGTPKKFRINGNFDEVIGNLNTMYQSSGKKVLQAEEKAPFPMSSPVPQEVTPVAPSVDTSSAGDLNDASMENISKEIYGNVETPVEPFSVNNAPLEPKPIQVDSPVDKVTPPEKPVEMNTTVSQPSIGMDGGINPLSPIFPTINNTEIFVSPTKPEIPVLPKNQEMPVLPSSETFISPTKSEMPVLPSSETFISPSQTGSAGNLINLPNAEDLKLPQTIGQDLNISNPAIIENLELPSVKDLEYRKVLEGLLGVIEISPESSIPKELSEGIKFYKEKLDELDVKYKNESNTNNLQP